MTTIVTGGGVDLPDLYHVQAEHRISAIDILRIALPVRPRQVQAIGKVDEYNAASPLFTEIESLMVRVNTSAGIVGWGEAFGHKVNSVTYAALAELVGPFYLGQTVDPVGLYQNALRSFHAFGRSGPVTYAISALDIAL